MGSNGSDAQIVVAVISAVGGVAVAWITVKYKDYVVKRNQKAAPKDRMDSIFDGYELLIKQQQVDIDRKSKQLDTTQEIIERLQTELDHTREIVRAQQRELDQSKETNRQIIEQLAEMKTQYGINKTRDVIQSKRENNN